MSGVVATPMAYDVKPFIGAKDFQLSKKFYSELGRSLNFESPEIAELQLSDSRFYLQKYYHKVWCHNTMFHISVDDAEAWYQHAVSVVKTENYGRARVKAPEPQDYGALVTFVWDPSGVLLHFAQYTNQATQQLIQWYLPAMPAGHS